MEQIYHPYWKWEDYINGMWQKHHPEEESKMLIQAQLFTGNHIEYGRAMMEVVEAWPVTMEHHLTDNSINQRAFVGHCAVCYRLGIPEHIVREAWHLLSEQQRVLANSVADKAIEKWNRKRNTHTHEQQEIQFNECL